jgi:hypothetical protein
MNKPPFEQPIPPDAQWVTHMQEAAKRFSYPPTPDIAQSVHQQVAKAAFPLHPRRRWVWAVAAILVCLAALLIVPQVRAAIVNWLHVGGVIIIPEASTTTPTVVPPTPNPTQSATPNHTPRPTSTAIQSILDLSGETTLVDAQKRVNFPIRLPTYPTRLPAPDRVYLQDLNGPVVVLVWLDPTEPDGIRFALHILGPGAFVYKMQPTVIKETIVNGQSALWTEGPYFLVWQDGSQTTWDMRQIVKGNVLIWTDGQITYRLESSLSLDEARNVAESIPPISP